MAGEGFISREQAADFLGVSVATLRNWVRTGVLVEFDRQFLLLDIEALALGIESGDVERLKGRANRSFVDSCFLPSEYLVDSSNGFLILKLVDFLASVDLSFKDFLFVFALRCFIDSGDFDEKFLDDLVVFEPHFFRRSCVRDFLFDLFNELDDNSSLFDEGVFDFLLNEVEYPFEEDVVGLVYQLLLRGRDKAEFGAYYTPKEIVDFQLSEIFGKERLCSDSKLFVDPCCGCGQYLRAFCSLVENPLDIYGFDVDRNSVFASRLVLLLEFADVDFSPNVFEMDSVLGADKFYGRFDYVITNPPWASRLGKEDVFSDFVVLAKELLCEDGRLSLVLPQSLSNVKKHLNTREIILQACKIISITTLGRRFKNVLSDVIILDAEKNKTVAEKTKNSITIKNLGNKNLTTKPKVHQISQQYYKENQNNNFDINISNQEIKQFEKLFKREHSTLKNSAIWGLGIVTGNNKKYIIESTPKLISKELIKNSKEKIITGKDISKYQIKPTSKIINFKPQKFQQVAPIEIYRAPQKLVYKFISKELTFALDSSASLTLNSANILIPQMPGQTIKTTLAFLNSKILNTYYQKKFATIKILRSNLETLPFPILTKSEITQIENLVDKILEGENASSNIKKLDYLIEEIYLMR